MSSNVLKSPDTLHNLCVGAVVDHYTGFRNEVRSVPVNILFDIYYKVILALYSHYDREDQYCFYIRNNLFCTLGKSLINQSILFPSYTKRANYVS